jgi:hypothetical protein
MTDQKKSNETKTLNTPVSRYKPEVLLFSQLRRADQIPFDIDRHGLYCDCYDCNIGGKGLSY